MSADNTEADLERPPPLKLVAGTQNEPSGLGGHDLNILCEFISKQQANNLNAFSDSLCHHLNIIILWTGFK